mmetsp:Transcript_53418/g.142929  ORF Transcript_53418/g.142929 Transcript_53418/m.142929 type:complete len:288 (-) Transcript_53418:633-1496(-)
MVAPLSAVVLAVHAVLALSDRGTVCSCRILPRHRKVVVPRARHAISAGCQEAPLGQCGFLLSGGNLVDRSALLNLVEHGNVIEARADAEVGVDLCLEEGPSITRDLVNFAAIPVRVTGKSNRRVILPTPAGHSNVVLDSGLLACEGCDTVVPPDAPWHDRVKSSVHVTIAGGRIVVSSPPIVRPAADDIKPFTLEPVDQRQRRVGRCQRRAVRKPDAEDTNHRFPVLSQVPRLGCILAYVHLEIVLDVIFPGIGIAHVPHNGVCAAVRFGGSVGLCQDGVPDAQLRC